MKFNFMKKARYSLLTLVVFGATTALTEEIKIMAGAAVYNELLMKKISGFESATKNKIVILNDIEKVIDPVKIAMGVLEKKTDIGFSASDSEEWRKMLTKAQVPNDHIAQLTFRSVGLLINKIFLNPGVQISNLNIEDIEKLMTGEIKNWKDLKGPDLKVILVKQKVSNARDAYFKTRVMKGKDFTKDVVALDTNAEIFDYVVKNPGSMGYLPDQVVDARKDILVPATPVLGRPIFATTLGKPTEKIVQFEDYIKKGK